MDLVNYERIAAMKIVYILKAMAMKAGTERVMCDKINWLADHGHKVTVVTYEQGDHPLSFPLNPDVKHIDLDVRFFKLSNIPFCCRIWKFRKMKALFATRLQNVLDYVAPNLIVTTTYSLKLSKEICNVRTEAKKMIESHSACFSVGKEYDFRDKGILKYFARIIDSFYFRNADSYNQLIVLTDGDKKDWEKYVRYVKTIPNPLTLYPEHISTKEPSCRILSVGRLTFQKGFDMLIDAFAIIASSYPKWHIDIYGNGEDKENLLNKIEKYSLQHQIRIYSPTEDIYQEYMNSDFYVLSSRYEGYPLVLNEAMSCGTPCVAFRCKYGPEDAIEDGKNGLLVKNGDVQDLADKIEWMILHEKERIDMGEKARIAAARYKKDQVMKEWEQAYLNV